MTIQKIIQNHVLDQVFTEYPSDLDTNAYDFFMRADVDCTEDVSMSPLGEEWGYEVCQAYELDNIRSIRGLMESMYRDLERLKTSLFQYAVKPMQLNKDECISDDVFYELVQEGRGILQRQGTADEYATILTVDEEAIN